MMKSSLLLFLVFLSIFYSSSCEGSKDEKNIIVNLKFDNGHSNDSICLFVINPFYANQGNSPNKKYIAVKAEDGFYHFKIPVKKNGYFQIALINNKDKMYRSTGNMQPLIQPSFFEIGDSVTISIKENPNTSRIIFHYSTWYSYSFSGRGSRKYKLMTKIDSMRRNISDSGLPAFDNHFHFRDPTSHSTNVLYNYIKERKKEVSEYVYWVLQADVIFDDNSNRLRFFGIQQYINSLIGLPKLTGYVYRIPDSVDITSFRGVYNIAIDTAFDQYSIPQYALNQSIGYLKYLILKVKMDCLVNMGNQRPDVLFNWVKSNYTGLIRDRLLTYLLVRDYYNSSKFNDQLSIALGIVRDSICLNALSKIKSRMSGTEAFDFSLPDENGKYVRLSQFKNQTVIIDFWYAGCGGCAEFYKSILSKAEMHFKNSKTVKFISISIDKEKDRWIKYLNSGLYSSNNAINLYTAGKGFNAEIIKHYNVITYPTFLIIKDGKIKYYNIPRVRHDYKYLIEIINSLEDS